jgi:hypothetical protein
VTHNLCRWSDDVEQLRSVPGPRQYPAMRCNEVTIRAVLCSKCWMHCWLALATRTVRHCSWVSSCANIFAFLPSLIIIVFLRAVSSAAAIRNAFLSRFSYSCISGTQICPSGGNLCGWPNTEFNVIRLDTCACAGCFRTWEATGVITWLTGSQLIQKFTTRYFFILWFILFFSYFPPFLFFLQRGTKFHPPPPIQYVSINSCIEKYENKIFWIKA